MNARIQAAILAALLSAPASQVSAAPVATTCPANYEAGNAPDVANPKLLTALREVCFTDFGVFNSGQTRTPLWSAEHLTAAGIAAAEAVPRVDVFHTETGLPASERSDLPDYRGSGYDRGHMSPAADMTSDQANNESFSLANMVPQDPGLNRGPWAEIEETVRKFATAYGEVYVVTGPAFIGTKLTRLNGRVLVPTATWKAVYLPKIGKTSAWWADNSGTGVPIEVISTAELAGRIGIDPFPAVPADAKAVQIALPLPHRKGQIHPHVAQDGTPVPPSSSPAKAGESGSWMPSAHTVYRALHYLLK